MCLSLNHEGTFGMVPKCHHFIRKPRVREGYWDHKASGRTRTWLTPSPEEDTQRKNHKKFNMPSSQFLLCLYDTYTHINYRHKYILRWTSYFTIVLYLQKVVKIVQGALMYLTPIFLYYSHLISVVHLWYTINKPILTHCYELKCMLYSDFLSDVPFLFQYPIHITMLHLVTTSP